MDNITRQNQFYETQVVKQENESGYEKRPLEVEQQQAYHPGRKAHVVQLLRAVESIRGPCPLPRAYLLRETWHLPLGRFIWALSLWQQSFEGKNLVPLPGVGGRESS